MARVINRTRDVTLADQAEIANTFWTRGKGLLGRRGLPEGGGLVIEPTSSIHTFFMVFPIDVAFVAKDGRVVATAHTLKPWRLGPFARKVRYVVELPAGTLARSGTVPNDYLDVIPGEPEAPAPRP
jgi:uncharacterized membrane protein (UPF0127 family)